jgi:hypothetical protein
MQSLNTYKSITTGATTVFAGNETKRVVLGAINVNKILTGTLVIKSGSTTIGTIAASAPIGEYWYSNTGTEIEDLQITNASTEDVTVFYRNI